MNCLSNPFEKRWSLIFLVLYVLIMLPLPWYYSETYHAGPLGIPLFLYGWMIHGWGVVIFIMIFAKRCLARPEYQSLDKEETQA